MKKILNVLLLSLAITLILTFSNVNKVNAGTVYNSSLEFNNTKDSEGKTIICQFYLVNETANPDTILGPYTLNSTGGFKFNIGIGNGTTYHLEFYWQGTKVYQTSSFETNVTAGSNNIVGPYTCPRLTTYINGSSVSLYITNSSGVTLSSASFSNKKLTATFDATGISIIKVFHGTDLQMPSKVFVGGRDITSYKVASEDLLGSYADCWYYDSTYRTVVIKGTHSSALTYEVQFAPPSGGWEFPSMPTTITIFNTAIPTVILLAVALLAIGAVAGGFLILAGRKE